MPQTASCRCPASPYDVERDARAVSPIDANVSRQRSPRTSDFPTAVWRCQAPALKSILSFFWRHPCPSSRKENTTDVMRQTLIKRSTSKVGVGEGGVGASGAATSHSLQPDVIEPSRKVEHSVVGKDKHMQYPPSHPCLWQLGHPYLTGPSLASVPELEGDNEVNISSHYRTWSQRDADKHQQCVMGKIRCYWLGSSFK